MMMGSMIVHLTQLRSLSECLALSSRAGMVCLGMVVMLWFGGTLAFAQGRFTDVLVSVVKDKVIAVTGVGQSEIDLAVGETVVSSKAHGLTALAITSTRLLGFSSQLRHWANRRWRRTSMSTRRRSFENSVSWLRISISMVFRKPSLIGPARP